MMTRSLGFAVALAMLALPAQTWAKPKTNQVVVHDIHIVKVVDQSSPHLFLMAHVPPGGSPTPTNPITTQHPPGRR